MARQLTRKELEELIRAQEAGEIPNITPDSSVAIEADWSKNPFGDFDYERQKSLRGTVGGGWDWRNIPTNIKEDAGLLFDKGKEALGGLMEHIPSAPFPTAGAASPDEPNIIKHQDSIDYYKNKKTTLNKHFPAGLYNTPLEGDDRGIGKAFVIHHTGSRLETEANLGSRKPHTPLSSGAGVHFVINRDGTIYQMTPTGMQAAHVNFGTRPDIREEGQGYYSDPLLGPLDNTNTMGVEIVARNDERVTDAQIEATLRLAAHLGYKKHEIVAHGKYWEVDDPHTLHKRATEGNRIMSALWGTPRQYHWSDRKKAPAGDFKKLRKQLFGSDYDWGESFL